MNNLEIECIEFVIDTLKNRPKDMSAKVKKYNSADRKLLLEIIKEQQDIIERYQEQISDDSCLLIKKIYDGLYDLISSKLI